MANDPWVPVTDVLAILNDERWSWASNAHCKYVELRIDTRDMHCCIKDRDSESITLHDLARQMDKHLTVAPAPQAVKHARCADCESPMAWKMVGDTVEVIPCRLCRGKPYHRQSSMCGCPRCVLPSTKPPYMTQQDWDAEQALAAELASEDKSVRTGNTQLCVHNRIDGQCPHCQAPSECKHHRIPALCPDCAQENLNGCPDGLTDRGLIPGRGNGKQTAEQDTPA